MPLTLNLLSIEKNSKVLLYVEHYSSSENAVQNKTDKILLFCQSYILKEEIGLKEKSCNVIDNKKCQGSNIELSSEVNF